MYGVHNFLSPSLRKTIDKPDSIVPHSVPMTAPEISHLKKKNMRIVRVRILSQSSKESDILFLIRIFAWY